MKRNKNKTKTKKKRWFCACTKDYGDECNKKKDKNKYEKCAKRIIKRIKEPSGRRTLTGIRF